MNIIKVDDYNLEELNIYTSMNETQLRHYYEPELGGFVAESPNVILRAMNTGYEPIHMLVAEGSFEESQAIDDRDDELLKDVTKTVMERMNEAPIYLVDFDRLKKEKELALIRGAMCFMRRKPSLCWQDVVAKKKPGRIALLEDVTNPVNLGAIFRSAAALGVDLVLMSKGCADPLYRRSTRVSMGTVFQVDWAYVDSVKETLTVLGGEGYKTAALALDDRAISITDSELKDNDNLVILLGAEGYGLKPDTIRSCDYTVMIPMSEGVDSLNVAAASAVAFWELRR